MGENTKLLYFTFEENITSFLGWLCYEQLFVVVVGYITIMFYVLFWKGPQKMKTVSRT